ncbi:hypothetical protein ACFQ0B_45235 [Nonomuraea thailandensis]
MGSTRTNLTILASILLMAGQAAGAGPAVADSCPVITDQWEVTDLGVTGSALDINDLGQIAGSSVSATGEQRATVWDGAQVIDLGSLGGGHAYAGALDEDGNVVGSSYTATEKGHAFHWRAGTMTDLGPFGIPTLVRDVSAGVIVGEYRYLLPNGTARYQAFRIQNGVRTDLAAVSGSNAAAVNPAGQIAGTQRRLEPPGPASQRTHRAFLWDDGVITELGTLGGQWSQAEGINGDGHIVGQSALGADGVVAGGYLWSAEEDAAPARRRRPGRAQGRQRRRRDRRHAHLHECRHRRPRGDLDRPRHGARPAARPGDRHRHDGQCRQRAGRDHRVGRGSRRLTARPRVAARARELLTISRPNLLRRVRRVTLGATEGSPNVTPGSGRRRDPSSSGGR